jgi:hypothetical protein
MVTAAASVAAVRYAARPSPPLPRKISATRSMVAGSSSRSETREEAHVRRTRLITDSSLSPRGLRERSADGMGARSEKETPTWPRTNGAVRLTAREATQANLSEPAYYPSVPEVVISRDVVIRCKVCAIKRPHLRPTPSLGRLHRTSRGDWLYSRSERVDLYQVAVEIHQEWERREADAERRRECEASGKHRADGQCHCSVRNSDPDELPVVPDVLILRGPGRDALLASARDATRARGYDALLTPLKERRVEVEHFPEGGSVTTRYQTLARGEQFQCRRCSSKPRIAFKRLFALAEEAAKRGEHDLLLG